ncbi:MAG: DUF2029 domain-containing protein [Cyanobacteria bacterium REEB67]|nr:DUF2029 domain-containing protein [Cyanobacteria bacterium REEB67]
MTEAKAKLKNQLWFAYIVFLTLWAMCVYNWLFQQIALHQFFAALDAEHRPYVSDFVNVYNSACLAAACLKGQTDIYSPALQAAFAAKLTAPVVPEHPFYLQYPPFLFSLVSPLALFDMLGAWLVWCGLGLLALLGCCIYLMRAAVGGADAKINRFTFAFLLIATLASYPAWVSVRLGQTSLLLVPGLVAFWLACRRKRYFLAGLASGVALVKLQYLPPIFMIGFILGTGHYLLGFLTIGCALTALSYLIVGADNIMRFPHALLSGESGKDVTGVAADQMQNLRGNLTLFLGADNPVVPVLSLLAFATTLLALLLLWWQYKKDTAAPLIKERHFRVLAAISTLLMLISSPHCHTQDYLALVVPCYWLWFELDRFSNNTVSKSDKILKQLILLFPIIGWPLFMLLPFIQVLLKIQPFFLWAVLVTVLSFAHYNRLLKQSNDAVSSADKPGE